MKREKKTGAGSGTRRDRKVKPVNAWWCDTCNTEEMDQAGMMKHLKEKHGLETDGLQCRKQMLMHMDGDTWFASKFRVTIGEGPGAIKLTNKTKQERSGEDAMYWA